MSGRVIAKMALKEDPSNYIIQHAMGVNVAGQVASVVAGGLVLAAGMWWMMQPVPNALPTEEPPPEVVYAPWVMLAGLGPTT